MLLNKSALLAALLSTSASASEHYYFASQFMAFCSDLPANGYRRTLYQCTWPACSYTCMACHLIEQHVRVEHLGSEFRHNGLVP
ncbi:hypothetical protein TYRP_021922 [Tyrophagus putrescentiae]|nr:hypothetical protein TYRP_021922 [Tyrophagus putrescentiae]